MDLTLLTQLITESGFPVACVVVLGWFVYKIYNDTTRANKENMDAVQEKCAEREERLYGEIKENREVTAQAVATIGLYADKLQCIQDDLSEIKADIAIIASKEE